MIAVRAVSFTVVKKYAGGRVVADVPEKVEVRFHRGVDHDLGADRGRGLAGEDVVRQPHPVGRAVLRAARELKRIARPAGVISIHDRGRTECARSRGLVRHRRAVVCEKTYSPMRPSVGAAAEAAPAAERPVPITASDTAAATPRLRILEITFSPSFGGVLRRGQAERRRRISTAAPAANRRAASVTIPDAPKPVAASVSAAAGDAGVDAPGPALPGSPVPGSPVPGSTGGTTTSPASDAHGGRDLDRGRARELLVGSVPRGRSARADPVVEVRPEGAHGSGHGVVTPDTEVSTPARSQSTGSSASPREYARFTEAAAGSAAATASFVAPCATPAMPRSVETADSHPLPEPCRTGPWSAR